MLFIFVAGAPPSVYIRLVGEKGLCKSRELCNESGLGVKLVLAVEKCHVDRRFAGSVERNCIGASHETAYFFARAVSF